MKRCIAATIAFLFLVSPQIARAADDDRVEVGSPQNNYEKDIDAVVRNKRYYKKGVLEFGLSGGILPYDSIYNHFLVGGKLTWHITDHFGWEIIDYQMPFGSVTTFTESLVSDPTKDIVKLDGVKLKHSIGTSFLMSPFYGKIRFFGAQVVYLDIYIALGAGVMNTDTIRYSHDGGTSYTTNTVASGWDLSINYGGGFKFFINNAFTLFFDLRNYMSNSQAYDGRAFRSNFAVSGGLSFFLPNLG